MNKLLKLSTALVLIGCLNHSANAVVQLFGSSSPSVIRGYVPVLGQPNTYQDSWFTSGKPAPASFVQTLPAGAKLLDRSGKVIPPISGSPAHYNNPPIAVPIDAHYNNPPIVAPVAVPAVPVPIVTSSPKPIAAPVATPAPNPASVQWMPTIYYRYPGLGGMIYVNDNNGIAYVQHSDGTKTTLPPVPNGQFLRRPAEYHLPVWLFMKLTQNPTDNSEYFVAADRTTPQNRIISVGSDGALQVKYVTQNQWTGRDGVVHQVPPVGSEGSINQGPTNVAQPVVPNMSTSYTGPK